MVQDARWPALPLLAVRGIQLFFTILVLGMSGYLVSLYDGYSVFWYVRIKTPLNMITDPLFLCLS